MKKIAILLGTITILSLTIVCSFAFKEIELPENDVQIEVKGNYRLITSNGIPDHVSGEFPNRNNPNSIRPQRYTFRVPAQPKVAKQITKLPRGLFGIAVNGVPFDPGTAEFWNRDPRSGWNYEAISGAINLGLDASNAHVQPNGSYHYHGLPTGLLSKANGLKQMTLVGYAADGFPIYNQYGYEDPNDANSNFTKMRSSYRIKQGNRSKGSTKTQSSPGGNYDGTFVEDYEYVAGLGDLDECNGRVGITPENPNGIYHYYITESFPYIPRNFRGTPDASFQRHPTGPPRNLFQFQPGGPPPPHAGFGPPLKQGKTKSGNTQRSSEVRGNQSPSSTTSRTQRVR